MSSTKSENAQRRRIQEPDGYQYLYCGCPLHLDIAVWDDKTLKDLHNTYCHLDHMHPRELGGHNGDENLVAVCRSYNGAKSKRSLMARRVPARRAAEYLRAPLAEMPSPHQAQLEQALAWCKSQIKPYVFPGETLRTSRKAGGQV